MECRSSSTAPYCVIDKFYFTDDPEGHRNAEFDIDMLFGDPSVQDRHYTIPPHDRPITKLLNTFWDTVQEIRVPVDVADHMILEAHIIKYLSTDSYRWSLCSKHHTTTVKKVDTLASMIVHGPIHYQPEHHYECEVCVYPSGIIIADIKDHDRSSKLIDKYRYTSVV